MEADSSLPRSVYLVPGSIQRGDFFLTVYMDRKKAVHVISMSL